MLIKQTNGRYTYGRLGKYKADRDAKNLNELCYHHTACCVPGISELPLENVLQIINDNHAGRLHPVANGYGNHIAYHFLIGMNGQIVQTRPLDEIGYHCANWEINVMSVGIVYVGDGSKKAPQEVQYKAMGDVVRFLRKKYAKMVLHPHFDFKNTACPGKLFDHNKFYSYVRSNVVPDWLKF